VCTGLVVVALVAVTLTTWAQGGSADAPQSGQQRGLILNQAADALVVYLPLDGALDRATPPEKVTEGFHKIIDQYVGTQVSDIFLNTNYQRTAYPSEVWDSYWDVPNPETDTSDWPRLTWLVHETGIDLYAVCIQRCREDGLSPWLSLRMNDTHYLDDPTKTSALWQSRPDLRRTPDGAFDFVQQEVRDYHLALIRELLARYDADGLELDWMRFPWLFKPGQEAAGRDAPTGLMREARAATDEASARRGHPVKIAVRVPAVPVFSVGLGIDAITWAREDLVDVLTLASVWRPSDTDQPIEDWRLRIGPTKPGFILAAGTDLWIQGTPGGLLMMNNIESMRGFSAAMLDRGADQIYLFNHFHHGTFNRMCATPDGKKVEKNDYRDLLCQAGELSTALSGPRRHVVTWHDPAPSEADNPRALPALLRPGTPAAFRVYTGPAPTSGSVTVRVGLDDLPGLDECGVSARLNGQECDPLGDLQRDGPFRPDGPDGNHVVKTVADVAPRVMQFLAPAHALRR